MISQSTNRTASAPLSRYARNTDSELIIRLMMMLSSALREELPIAERILVLMESTTWSRYGKQRALGAASRLPDD
jgi:hypothetical protein